MSHQSKGPVQYQQLIEALEDCVGFMQEMAHVRDEYIEEEVNDFLGGDEGINALIASAKLSSEAAPKLMENCQHLLTEKNSQSFRENQETTTESFRESGDSSTSIERTETYFGLEVTPAKLRRTFTILNPSKFEEVTLPTNQLLAISQVALNALETEKQPVLTVWYGSMPESNGKKNWTAILHRKGESRSLDGITIDRSEYPERVKYAADRVRYLLGELVDRPCISSYDSEKHSGYVARVHPNEVSQRLEWLISDAHNAACNLEIGDDRTAAFELYEVLRRLQRRGAASQMLGATNPLLVEGMNHPVSPDSWFDCQAIANIEEVDLALRQLVDDATGDNGVRVVQAILHAIKVA